MATKEEVEHWKDLLRKQIALTDAKSAEIERITRMNLDGLERAKTAEAVADGLRWEIGELKEFIEQLAAYIDPAGRQDMCNRECPAYSMCAGKSSCMFADWVCERAMELGLELKCLE